MPDGLVIDGPATQAALAEGVERHVLRVKALLEGSSLAGLLPDRTAGRFDNAEALDDPCG